MPDGFNVQGYCKLTSVCVAFLAALGKNGCHGLQFLGKRPGTMPEVRAKLTLSVDEMKLLLAAGDQMLMKILGRLKVVSAPDEEPVVYSRISKQFDNNGLEYLSTMLADMLIYDEEEGQLITKAQWDESNVAPTQSAAGPAVGRTGQLIGGEYHFVEARLTEGTNQVVVTAVNVHGQSLQPVTITHQGDEDPDLPELEHYARAASF